MNHYEFFPYHNRHIVFRLKNGSELSGVIVSDAKHGNEGKGTVYKFIPTSKLSFWKRAEKTNDIEKMAKYESRIDIENITWAMRLNY